MSVTEGNAPLVNVSARTLFEMRQEGVHDVGMREDAGGE